MAFRKKLFALFLVCLVGTVTLFYFAGRNYNAGQHDAAAIFIMFGLMCMAGAYASLILSIRNDPYDVKAHRHTKVTFDSLIQYFGRSRSPSQGSSREESTNDEEPAAVVEQVAPGAEGPPAANILVVEAVVERNPESERKDAPSGEPEDLDAKKNE